MKKYIVILEIIILMLFSNVVYGEELDKRQITSKAAILMEQSTGRILFDKMGKEKLKIASTTKILTAIVAVENCDLEDEVIISSKAAKTGGSTVGLIKGKTITMKKLLYGLLLKSGNDCAVAIAEHVGKDTATFAKMMNDKAKEIGAFDTYCTNPHGLDTDENYSTAYDVAKIMSYALNIEEISRIINTKNIYLDFFGTTKQLTNTNKLLSTYKYCIGGKTGYTAKADRCLVAAAKKDEMTVIAVVLGAVDTKRRFDECKLLLEYGIDNYTMVNVEDKTICAIQIPIIKGKEKMYKETEKMEITLPLREDEIEKIELKKEMKSVIYAPLMFGNEIGNMELILENEILYSKKIYITKDILKKDVLDYIVLGMKEIFNV